MNDNKQRMLKFRAWDEESRLLIRLNKLECNKGVLSKKGFIFLQFTGMFDKQGEEIYEMDVLLFQTEKRLVFWSEKINGWCLAFAMDKSNAERLHQSSVKNANRLCSYYELPS